MKSIVITPKDDTEFKFIASLLKKLGINASALSEDEVEDLGMSRQMIGIDKSKKVTRGEIMKKLAS